MLRFTGYSTDGFYDEFFKQDGKVRQLAMSLVSKLKDLPEGDLQSRQKAAEKAFLNLGITFNVYGDSRGSEKIFPFDIIPRLIEKQEWDVIEKGLKQRITALNLFINDIYNDQKILKDKVIDPELVLSASTFRKQCVGFTPPKGIWCNITGTDLVRGDAGQMYVLEDNLRCPSGVSYVLENRQILKRTFPQLFEELDVQPVDDYPSKLLDMLQYISPNKSDSVTVALLTPGIYNSAYFEHTFLARQMGVELVQGSDLIVKDDFLYMRTTKGLQRIDVLYRRIDDDFLDPKEFRKDSMIGIPGIMKAYKAGKLGMANAPGTGVADDKAIYTYVPKIIKYYLGEDPIIPNVPTYVCANEVEMKHVLQNIHNMVVKTVDASGGYGMLIGPKASQPEILEFGDKIRQNPRSFIAQPVVNLSRVPVIVENNFEGRHVDLRPYIVYGKDIYITPGGLTRVALIKDSLVVNSSQGGGSKDTWVVSDKDGI